MYQRTPEDKYFEAEGLIIEAIEDGNLLDVFNATDKEHLDASEELIDSTEKLSEFDMLILNSEYIEPLLARLIISNDIEKPFDDFKIEFKKWIDLYIKNNNNKTFNLISFFEQLIEENLELRKASDDLHLEYNYEKYEKKIFKALIQLIVQQNNLKIIEFSKYIYASSFTKIYKELKQK